MKKRVLALSVTAAMFLSVMWAMASAVPGSPADPLVTLSYIRDKFTPVITDEADKRAVSALDARAAGFNALLQSQAGALYRQIVDGTVNQALINAVNTKSSPVNTGGSFKLAAGTNGQTLNFTQGSSVVLVSGGAKLNRAASDLTSGSELASGTSLTIYHEVVFFDGGGSVSFTSNAALLVNGVYAFYAPAYIPKYNDLAAALKSMGLLRGTGAGFDLGRAATRTEALYMMLYLLGEINAAEAYTGKSPFTDVPSWASAAVAYAYDKGYTKGVSAVKFGSDDKSTPAQYLTMLLRVMGFDDSSGDFVWDQSLSFAVSVGLLTDAEEASLNTLFYRDQMVYVSYYALDGWMKDNSATLQQTLILRGVLSGEAVFSARGKVTRTRGMQ